MKQGQKCSRAVISFCALIWWFSLPTSVVAEERAHQHGVGQLNIAIEGNHVELELIVPGSDAVGFEHAPSTAKDRRAVQSAAKKLRAGKQLFVFPKAAGCRFEKAELHSEFLDAAKHDGHHVHEKHGHHHGEHTAKESHAEFRVHYHIECASPSKLTHLDVVFFKAFPSAHKLMTRWISARRQGAAALSASSVRLSF